jgi:hypothetical protein
MNMKHPMAIVLLLLVATPIRAEVMKQETANFMLPYCKQVIEDKITPPTLENGYHAGRCMGMVEAMSLLGGREYCTPDGATFGQEIRIIVAYIESHPAIMHEAFTTLGARALVDAWPCPKR